MITTMLAIRFWSKSLSPSPLALTLILSDFADVCNGFNDTINMGAMIKHRSHPLDPEAMLPTSMLTGMQSFNVGV